MKQCLGAGNKCIIDIHNYGRWEGKEITGGMNQHFSDLWAALGKEYATEKNVIFGIMNEPHDQDGAAWQETCQAAVDAIREAGAKDQQVLIPGPPWNHVSDFAELTSKFSFAIKDKADESGKNLIMDLHSYFDEDNSGTHTECAPYSKAQPGFESAVKALKQEGRQAFLSEIGGGNTDSCVETMGEAFDYINENADVFMGWTGWGVGGFVADYELIESPQGDKDRLIVEKVIGGKFKNPGTKKSESPAKESPDASEPSPSPATPPSYSPSSTPAGGSTPSPAPAYGAGSSGSSSSMSPSRTPSSGGYNPPASPSKPKKNKCKAKKPKTPMSPASPVQYGGSSSSMSSVSTPTPSPNASYNYPAKPEQPEQPQQPQQPQKPQQPQQPQQYDSGSSQNGASNSNPEPKSYRKYKRAPYNSGANIAGGSQKLKRNVMPQN